MQGDVRVAERVACAEGRAMSLELQEVNEAASAFTRRTALSIATMAPDTRIVAFQIAEHELDKAIRSIVGDSSLGHEWLAAQMADIRALVAEIDASGGAGRRSGVGRRRGRFDTVRLEGLTAGDNRLALAVARSLPLASGHASRRGRGERRFRLGFLDRRGERQ
jgi:hypothetical protein